MKKMNKKGFTLAELLIVVAIIAVLVAIAIPVFNAQLEKSRQATDLANLRSSYAEAMATLLTDGVSGSGTQYKMQETAASMAATMLTNVDTSLAGAITGKNLSGKTAGISVWYNNGSVSVAVTGLGS